MRNKDWKQSIYSRSPPLTQRVPFFFAKLSTGTRVRTMWILEHFKHKTLFPNLKVGVNKAQLIMTLGQQLSNFQEQTQLRTCSLLKTHLKLVKTKEAGFTAYLHGNWWYGIIGEHFPQPSFWQALFPPVDSFKHNTNVKHILKHTCTGKATLEYWKKGVISPVCIMADN